MKTNVIILVTIILCIATLYADDKKPAYIPAISGYASFEAGQVVKGRGIGDNPELSHKWTQTGYAGLNADALVNERLRIVVGLEGSTNFSFSTSTGAVDMYRETETARSKLTIKRGEGIYTCGSADLLLLQLEAGFFPYKYNPDVRNLGEYLFRSFPYPQFIINTFDRTYVDIAGLRIGNTLGKNFHHDLLLTTEIRDYPLMDFSVSYVAGYTIPKALDAGIGIMFDRCLSVNERFTTPKGDPANKFYTSSGDSGYYSFAGIKTMARLSLDPKFIIPSSFFGLEDLKLYSEVAILGLQDYPVKQGTTPYYTNIIERMPVMLGFNFPTCAPGLKDLIGFKLLDVLNMELEYFPNKFPNSYTKTFENYLPLPVDDDASNKHDNLKWSFYAKREFGEHFGIIFQVAHDHLMPTTFTLAQGQTDRTDVLLRHGDWWWVLKTQFSF